MHSDRKDDAHDRDGEDSAARGAQLDGVARKYTAALHRFFRRRTRHGDVEDLTQEVFARLSGRSDERAILQIEGYLFETASNVLRDRFRRGKVRGEGLHSEYIEERHAIEDFSPERVLIGKQEIDLVLTALQSLPDKVREAFVLHRFEHLTYPEIARRLGVSVSSVEKYIMQALKEITVRRREAE